MSLTNYNDGPIRLDLAAGSTARQQRIINFPGRDGVGSDWRLFAGAGSASVNTPFTIDDGTTTKMTINPGASLTNTVQFGTGAQLAPILRAALTGTAAPNGTLLYCSDCAAGACRAGTGAVAVRKADGWTCF